MKIDDTDPSRGRAVFVCTACRAATEAAESSPPKRCAGCGRLLVHHVLEGPFVEAELGQAIAAARSKIASGAAKDELQRRLRGGDA